jgi:ankyrin repeat protein
MAAKKKPAQRGVALIEQVIARVEASKASAVEVSDARPIAPAALKKLAFSNGAPLPPSLRRWLAFDGAWLMRTFGWPDDLDTPVLQVSSVAKLVKDHLQSELWRAFSKLPKPLPSAEAIALDAGSESMRFLFLGLPDDDGEYPVLNLDVDDMPVIGFESAGFDTWLARMAGVPIGDEAAARRRIFGKREELECTHFNEDDDEAAEPEPVAPKPRKSGAKSSGAIQTGVDEEKLGKALAEAIEVRDERRVDAYLADAATRFPNAKVWGGLALRQVVHGDNVALVKRLFEAGADPNAIGPYGAHFQTAAEYASLEVVTAFIDAGATLDLRSGSAKETALTAACGKGRADVVKLLLSRGADPNVVDGNKMGPLHHTTTPEIATMLLERGAELNRQDGNGRSALHWAIEQSNQPLFDLLVARKADPNLKQWAGDTALTLAHRHRREGMYAPLRALGARSDIKNKEGWSVDDLTSGEPGPKAFDVRLSTAPGPHTAKLSLDVTFKHAMVGADLFVVSLAQFAAIGCVGSDVFPPPAGKIELKGGGLPDHGKGSARWEITYEGVAPAVFAQWMRRLLGPRTGFTVLKMSLVSDGEPTIDTKRARDWLNDAALDPYRAWPDPGFTVTDAALDPGLLARVSTSRALDKEQVQTTVLWLQVVFGALPQNNPNKPGNVVLQANAISAKAFDITIRLFEKNAVFPYDRATARALTINALAKLHHETKAIRSVECATT